jgi:SH3-like domain-containing protein
MFVLKRNQSMVSGLGLIFLMVFCQTAYAERMSISASTANIRSGPGNKGYEILWKAEKYYPIDVLEKKGDWYFFKDFEGDKGWINKSLVSQTPSVITKADKCNVRSEPGSGSNVEILFTLEKGVPFKVLETKGDWIRVEHADGDKGWINQSLVW